MTPASSSSGAHHRQGAVALLALLASGCASYGYAARGKPPNYQAVAVDQNAPLTSLRWGHFWAENLWSPIGCAVAGPNGTCTRADDPCGGLGVGRIELSLAWYSAPLALLTLGIAVPIRMTAYCVTATAPGKGP